MKKQQACEARKVKKVVCIGLDGMIPELMLKFCKEGILPNIDKLMKKGIFLKMLPAVQVDTPTNWTTILTGAWPKTHGINSFGFHVEGESFDKVYDMGDNLFPIIANINTKYYMNRLSKAEYLWQTAEKAGKKVLIVNFPGGWPPNIKKGIVIDGTGPYSSPISRLCKSDRFSSKKGQNIVELKVVKAFDWKTTPHSNMPLLETCMDISGEYSCDFNGHSWVSKKISGGSKPNESVRYFVLILAKENKYYDTIIISKDKNVSHRTADLEKGQVSDWITEEFYSTISERVYANMVVRREFKSKIQGILKLKLSSLSANGKMITIDRTPIFNLGDWAYPSNISRELINDLLSTTAFNGDNNQGEKHVSRKSPLCQVYETVPDMAKGIAGTCKLLAERYSWDMLFTQIHAPDGIHHDELNSICSDSPTYDVTKENESWDRIRGTYRILDEMVGEIAENCVDEETLTIVLSDHGCIPTRKRVMIELFLRNEGLIVYKKNSSGRLVIDLTKSKVISGINYVTQNIWINLEGRDPSGIVAPTDFEKVRSKVLNILTLLKDPETGERPISLVLRKEDAKVLGQGGNRLGDVIYFFKEGYTNKFANGITGIDPGDIPRTGFELVLEGPEFGRHHSYLPEVDYCGCSVKAIFIMSGPGIRKNYVRPSPIRTVDVAPTIAFLANINYPAQSEGMVIRDILDN